MLKDTNINKYFVGVQFFINGIKSNILAEKKFLRRMYKKERERHPRNPIAGER